MGSNCFCSWKCFSCFTTQNHDRTGRPTGLRLDGLLALEFWDLIVSVFGSLTQTSDRKGRPVNIDVKRNQKSQGKINVMENIDYVPSNVQFSQQEALMCLRTTKQ